MALLDATDGKDPDSFVQIVEQSKFLPRRHTPDEFYLELLHFGIGIGIQGAHDFSIAHIVEIFKVARVGLDPATKGL